MSVSVCHCLPASASVYQCLSVLVTERHVYVTEGHVSEGHAYVSQRDTYMSQRHMRMSQRPLLSFHIVMDEPANILGVPARARNGDGLWHVISHARRHFSGR